MKFLLVACVWLVASCGDDDCCAVVGDAQVPDVSMPDAQIPDPEVVRVRVTPNPDIDLLFVVDDSPSMLDKQTNLKNAFPAFIAELSTLEGGLPNLHIGVITSDLGTKGADDAQPGPGIGSGPGSCAGNGKAGNMQTTAAVQGQFIVDTGLTDGTRVVNYTGQLASAFSAIASVGANGCGFEQPLQAAKNALNNNAANAGFVRPNASLAIVIVTDEDDCSISHSTLFGSDVNTLGPLQSFRCTRFGVQCDVGGANSDAMNAVGPKSQCHSNESSPFLTHVEDYVSFFNGLKPDPHMVLFAAVLGDTSPFGVELRTPPGGGTAIAALAHSCSYTGAMGIEVSDPGVRLAQLAGRFAHSKLASVCAQDLSAPLADIAREVRGLVGDSCLLRDIAMPPDCIVHEEVGTVSTQLPACNNGASSTNTPCYELVGDPVKCTGGPHLRLVVQRGATAPSPSAVVVASCKV